MEGGGAAATGTTYGPGAAPLSSGEAPPRPVAILRGCHGPCVLGEAPPGTGASVTVGPRLGPPRPVTSPCGPGASGSCMCRRALCQAGHGGRPLQWRGPHLILTLLLLHLARIVRGPRPAGAAPAAVAAPQLREVEAQLTNLTKRVTSIISDRSRFCIADPEEDWNAAFNYTFNLDFLQQCLVETRGDLVGRLCTPAEVRFYFSCLHDQKGMNNIFLNTTINCNQSSWVQGCEPGWTCSVSPDILLSNINSSMIPPRTTNCQQCCKGFFCPRGLTCMLPCPLGSYCPHAKLNITTGLCDPYKYQFTPNSRNACGGADMWADYKRTEDVFCPAGYYCPTATSKKSCSSGHYCRLGSTTEDKCIIKDFCKENTKNESIFVLGACLVGALSVVLLIIYNFSDQFLTIRERRKTRSRDKAIKMARQQIRAQKHWKVAKQPLKSHVNGSQSHVPHTLGSFAQHADREDSTHRMEETPMVPLKAQELSLKAQELSEASVFESEGTNEISESASSVVVISGGGGETAVTKNKCALKGKYRSTVSQRFKYAYVSIEKEKIEEQENKNLSSSSVITTVSEQNEISRPLLKVEFKDLTLTLGKNKLLRSITGELQPGHVTAVMGPSGAGKTTFLNAIAGKVAGYKINGSIRVNGKYDKIRSYKKIIGFVPQGDIVHGNLTVEENLWFSAKCRLCTQMPQCDKVLTVVRVIDSLGLETIKNSLVGTVEKRGISGWQRKRVNVGIEMVMKPSLLMLDEPTSGLDSSSSQLLLKALRHGALEGTNICTVIHQPSYTLYSMFDDLILLAKGGLIVYCGPVNTIEEYFKTLEIHVPDCVNPPDHYIDILEGIVESDSGIKAKHLPLHWMLYNGYEVPNDMKNDMETMHDGNRTSLPRSMPNQLPNIRNTYVGEQGQLQCDLSRPKDLLGRTPGILIQYKYFLGRVMKQSLREAGLLAVDFLILCLAGICLGILAKFSDPTFGMPGYIYTIIAVSLRSNSLERLQYKRERESGMSSFAYFLARDTIDHFNTVMKPVVYLSMFYYFSNPRSTMADDYTVLLALVYCVTGIGYTLAFCFNPALIIIPIPILASFMNCIL
ncbi:unnamed protein product [Miscanthus lutarioriparius]|uniref:ABC transporter domain-containing protein n=1 Tax=Miscanthus lutarioriparius TaxID=422564 RepID=A0A811QQF1_9POAL|nr:unnamed protein product [Miscanthus lutarioriparius]